MHLVSFSWVMLICNINHLVGGAQSSSHTSDAGATIQHTILREEGFTPNEVFFIKTKARILYLASDSGRPVTTNKQSIIRITDRRNPPTREGSQRTRATIRESIERKAIAYGIPTDLALKAAFIESSFNPDAIGDNGCSIGLYQWNTCARGEAPPSIVDAWMIEISEKNKIYNNWYRSAVHWNCPACASSGKYKTVYYYKLIK